MSFWTTALPLAGMAAGYAVGGPVGMAAGGALGGAAAGEARERAEKNKEARTLAANAAATEAAWARKNGVGNIPEIRYASNNDYALQGAVGAGMQGFSLGNAIAGAPPASAPPTPGADAYSSSMFAGGNPYATGMGAIGQAPATGGGMLSSYQAPSSYNLGLNTGSGGFDYLSAQKAAPTYTLFSSPKQYNFKSF